MSPLFLCLKDYQWLPTSSHHYSHDDRMLFLACAHTFPHSICTTPCALLCTQQRPWCRPPGALSGGEASPEVSRSTEVHLIACCPTMKWVRSLSNAQASFLQAKQSHFLNSVKEVHYQLFHFPASPGISDFMYWEKDHRPDPAVSWGTDPGPQQRMMLCSPLNKSELFCSFLTVLLFDILFLTQKILEMGSHC